MVSNPRKQLRLLPQLAATCRSPSNQPFIPVFSPHSPRSYTPRASLPVNTVQTSRYLANTLSIPSSKNSQKHHDSAQKQRQVSGNFGRVGEVRFCRDQSNPAFTQQYPQLSDRLRATIPSLSTNMPVRLSCFDDTRPVTCSNNRQKSRQIAQKLRQVRGNFGRFRELRFCRGVSIPGSLQHQRHLSGCLHATYSLSSTNTRLTPSYSEHTPCGSCSKNI